MGYGQEAERKAGEQKIKDEQFGSQLIDRLLQVFGSIMISIITVKQSQSYQGAELPLGYNALPRDK